jgi:hypothetical protein
MQGEPMPGVRLDLLLAAAGLPTPTPEFRFRPPRRWRFDWAWVPQLVALEIDGGVWVRGRHTRGKGYDRDIEKLNTAALLGWLVLRVTPAMVEDGRAVAWVEAALRLREK